MSLQSKKAAEKLPQPTPEQLIEVISEALLEKKAENIRLLDVRKVTTLTDYFIVCHGLSDTQVKAIGDNVVYDVKNSCGEHVWRKEGHNTNRWIVLDYVSVVVHIFLHELRDFYGIEKMWQDAEITEIKD
ncbi:MAG: ribosome silencing factor [Bacteroidetes bacterium]|nr:ribosome silencing factor [Bacteroidota bacterium]MCH8525090.1 ribosome silencing factor [Balneolales bacterium]